VRIAQKQYVDGNDVEVWQLTRVVGTLKHEQRP
jgi:hypothetical protein